MVLTGLDVLSAERAGRLAGRKVGVLCHPASVASDLTHVVERLIELGVRPVRLFGPEHGVRGEAQDMAGVESGHDSRTAIPVTSLYGSTVESLSPTGADLDGIDVLVIDLQDVGSRYYTYIWTMGLAMKAAAAQGVSVLVLDRPNPLGGHDIEGGPVMPGFESFVGFGSVPVRHGLTMGEMARLIARGLSWGPPPFDRPLDIDLTVETMRGWRRDIAFDETGQPWVLPSPNMPTVDTAFVYPGMCLFEGTNLSEGRGVTRPFEIVGAPFLDGERWARDVSALDLPGLRLRPLCFRPTFHKFGGQSCGGVQVHVTDRRSFRPYRTGLALLAAARVQSPEAFAWRTEPYEFVRHPIAIDLLNGTDAIRLALEGAASVREGVIQVTRILRRSSANLPNGGARPCFTEGPMLVALFGGSFNPPHIAHQMVGLYVLETAAVDELWFVPTFQHAFDKPLAPFGDRYAMCERAVAALGPRARVCDVEARLGGPSRTLKTVERLRQEHPGKEFSLVIGADLNAEISSWYGATTLRQTVPFIEVGRQGTDSGAAVAMPAISSTEIRARLASGGDVGASVPKTVLDYIASRGLYGLPATT